MKIKKLTSTLASIYFLVAPLVVRADAKLDNAVRGTLLESRGNAYVYIGAFIQYAIGTLGIILIILIIYGGFIWMTANGDSAKVDKAKGIIIASVIGLIIVLAAYVITYTVITSIPGASQQQ